MLLELKILVIIFFTAALSFQPDQLRKQFLLASTPPWRLRDLLPPNAEIKKKLFDEQFHSLQVLRTDK